MVDALCDRGHTPYRQIGHRALSTTDRAAFLYRRYVLARRRGRKLKPAEASGHQDFGLSTRIRAEAKREVVITPSRLGRLPGRDYSRSNCGIRILPGQSNFDDQPAPTFM
jgi:hypothetical protein